MSEIKTALERFKAYCASKGIPEKSSLVHIHKIGQFEEHERKELRAAYEALQADNDALRKQLPEEMQECTIQFKECDKGHGRLTATNWVQHDCYTCRIEALQKENVGLRERVKTLLGVIAKRYTDIIELNKKLRSAIADNEAQAKRIEAIETLCTHDYESKDDFIWRVKEKLKNGAAQ